MSLLRSLPRSAVSTLFAAALSLWICCLLASPTLEAAPKWVRIGVPSTNADSAMRVVWNDDLDSKSGVVHWGKVGAPLSSQLKSSVFKGKGKTGYVHEALISGLLPATSYSYNVSSGASTSETFNFRTAPQDGCSGFSFIAGGDHRSDDSAGPNPKWASIIQEMKAQKPNFVLESGDLVRAGESEKQWIAHMNMAEALTPWVPMMTCLGNHDTDKNQGSGAYYNQLFPLPKNPVSKTRDYYAFTYGNMVVVALSTVTYAEQGFAAQAKWLDDVLTKNKDKAWKVVFYHHPSYTSYVDLKIADLNHPANEKGQNKAFLPIFDKHGVDLVLTGHNHFYERFSPMKNGKIVGTGQGTVYVTSGGAGAFTYDIIDIGFLKIEPMKVICGKGVLGVGGGKAKGSQACNGKHHYILLEVQGDTLTAKVLATAAQNLGTSDKNKAVIDSFSFTKKGASALCQDVDPGTDAGGTDAGGGTDVGGGPIDAGIVEQDAGTPGQDAGTTALDSGALILDAGSPSADADANQEDASDDVSSSKDVGASGEPDTGTEKVDTASSEMDAEPDLNLDTAGAQLGDAPRDKTLDGAGAGANPGGTSAQNDGNNASGCSAGDGSQFPLYSLVPLLIAFGLLMIRRRWAANT